MKKLFTFFMTFNLIIVSVLALPFDAYAQSSNAKSSTDGLYEVSSDIYADAYMLINLDDDSYPVVASKNAQKKKYPASLTKIVTTMVTLNNVSDLSQKTTVSKRAIEALYGTDAQVAGLKTGDELTIEQLLYLTMVHSACDACQVLADYVGGGVDGFVKMMNDYVKSLGCTNTNFVNPDGLHDDNHYTTAADMATITLDAMKNDTFNKISETQSYEYDGTTFIHTNYMLDKYHVSYYYEYAKGIKTGSTEQAGYCVITKASKDGYNYLAVVMDSPIKHIDGYDTKCSFIDAATLFEWAFNGLKYTTVVKQNTVVTEIPVEDGKNADTVQLVAQKDITSLVPKSLDESTVIIEPVNMPSSLSAPVSANDVVCSADIIYAGKKIGSVNLTAANDVELSTFLKILNALKSFFTNKIVIALIVLAVVCILLYIALFAVRTVRDKKRIARKRKRQEELDNNDTDDYLPPPKR